MSELSIDMLDTKNITDRISSEYGLNIRSISTLLDRSFERALSICLFDNEEVNSVSYTLNSQRVR